jgi:tRNA(Ile)-lysidine synthase
MNQITSVLSLIDEYNMIKHGDSVLCCVSGGADSMCLLHILFSLREKLGITVSAAHFNHNLRGEESDGDENFVVEYCRKLGVPIYIGSGDVHSEAERTGRGVEETARAMRYDFFYAVAKEQNINRIATAHNADDNLETVLMRIGRGTGLLGLGGIPPVRDSIIRPLLTLTRASIEDYLLENSIPHREDSTNFSDDYSRNKIRHHVMPVLREINPEASSVSANMTRLLRKDNDFLTELSRKFLEENYKDGYISASALGNAPFSVSSRAIRSICGDGLSYDHVVSILNLAKSKNPSDKLSIPGMTLRREYDKLVFGDIERKTFSPVELPIDGKITIPEINAIFISKSTILHGTIYKSLTSFLFKWESICGKIVVRPRISGDTILMSEKSGTKSLKKLFIEKKIPAHVRDSIPIIADDVGPLAIPGIGCSLRVKPEDGDKILNITFEEIKNYECY